MITLDCICFNTTLYRTGFEDRNIKLKLQNKLDVMSLKNLGKNHIISKLRERLQIKKASSRIETRL